MHASAKRKKQRERYFLQAFLRIANLAATLIEEREAPDFLLDVEGRLVGLEVTEVFLQNNGELLPPKIGEAIVDEIVARARRSYEERGGKPLHVSFGFLPNAEMRHIDRRGAGDAIANFLLRFDPPMGGLVKLERAFAGRDALPEQLTFMHVLAVPTWTMGHWWAPKAGWVAPLITDFLQPSVDEKAKKIAQYRQAADEAWLLLAIEGRAPSQFFEPSETLPTVSSPFDRTYLLSLFGGTVQLLPRAIDDA
jgi:hypothetical protein